MIQIDNYSEYQLDRATSILIDLFERFTYDYDNMILYYKNTSISDLQATVLYYGNLAKTIVDDSVESCEELRKFMENIGVEDTSIIDYIENILRKGGEVVDAAVKITERVNNDDQPTPDVTCSDDSSDYEDWDDEPEITDDERDTEIERIAPEPEAIKEMEETKKAEVDPAKVEEARAKQEEADKAADKAAQARAEANEAKAKADEAKDAYNKALDDLKDAAKGGVTVDAPGTAKNNVTDIITSIGSVFSGKDSAEGKAAAEEVMQNAANNAVAEAKAAAAEVIAKGGTAEEAQQAFDKTYQDEAAQFENIPTPGGWDWTVNVDTQTIHDAIAEAAEARDNAAKAELGAETAEEAAHAAENAANTAAEEAAEAVEEANNPPCADCADCADSCDSCDCDCDETPCDSTPCTDDTPPCSDDTCVGDCADEPCVDCADAPCADCADTPCADCADTPCVDCADCASDTDVCPSDAACDYDCDE